MIHYNKPKDTMAIDRKAKIGSQKDNKHVVQSPNGRSDGWEWLKCGRDERLDYPWGQADVQSQLDRVTRNRQIYERIARDVDNLVWERTWEQCRTKMKNLTQRYRKERA